MAASPKFKVYLVNEAEKVKTITESHPKLDASNDDFEAATDALINVYGDYDLQEVVKITEAKVYPAA